MGTTDSCFLTLSTHVISSVKDASDNSPEEKVIVIYLTIYPSVTKVIALHLKFVKDEKKNPGNQTEYEPIATKEMSSCFKKDFSSDQKLMHLVKLGVISRDLFYSKDENLGLIDVKSPTASCWWNENLDLVNTPRHSFSSSQWDCSEVVISLIWKKKYIKFFVFFITEVQCIFF